MKCIRWQVRLGYVPSQHIVDKPSQNFHFGMPLMDCFTKLYVSVISPLCTIEECIWRRGIVSVHLNVSHSGLILVTENWSTTKLLIICSLFIGFLFVYYNYLLMTILTGMSLIMILPLPYCDTCEVAPCRPPRCILDCILKSNSANFSYCANRIRYWRHSRNPMHVILTSASQAYLMHHDLPDADIKDTPKFQWDRKRSNKCEETGEEEGWETKKVK